MRRSAWRRQADAPAATAQPILDSSRPSSHAPTIMKPSALLAFLLMLGLLAFAPCPVEAQEEPAAGSEAILEDASGEPAAATAERSAEATLVWWNRPLVVFRSTTTQLGPKARVADALEKIEAASDALLEKPVTTEPAEVEDDTGLRFVIGDEYLFTLLESDLDELEGEELAEVGKQVLATFEEIRAGRIEQGSAKAIATAVTRSLVATLILVVALIALRFITRAVARVVAGWIKKFRRLHLARADLRPHFASLGEQLLKIAGFLFGLYLFCLWVAFVFHQFPLTEPLGFAFTERLKDFGFGLLKGIAASIPGLVTAGLILLIARWVARMTDRVIRSIGRDDDTGLLASDTAKATRRIAAACIWIFGIVLAYPYLPGSGSDAFKGISVLLGLMVSLGSTGMINQVMSGFVLLYSGSVRTGEYVKVGEIEGTVTEMGLLAACRT